MKRFLIVIVLLLQGCEQYPNTVKCNTQQCEAGILIVQQCLGRYGTPSKLIIVDENGEALRCKTNH